MKKRVCLAVIVCAALVYAGGAFVMWEWNPGAWSEAPRFVVFVSAALFGAFAGGAAAGL